MLFWFNIRETHANQLSMGCSNRNEIRWGRSLDFQEPDKFYMNKPLLRGRGGPRGSGRWIDGGFGPPLPAPGVGHRAMYPAHSRESPNLNTPSRALRRAPLHLHTSWKHGASRAPDYSLGGSHRVIPGRALYIRLIVMYVFVQPTYCILLLKWPCEAIVYRICTVGHVM